MTTPTIPVLGLLVDQDGAVFGVLAARPQLDPVVVRPVEVLQRDIGADPGDDDVAFGRVRGALRGDDVAGPIAPLALQVVVSGSRSDTSSCPSGSTVMFQTSLLPDSWPRPEAELGLLAELKAALENEAVNADVPSVFALAVAVAPMPSSFMACTLNSWCCRGRRR